MKTHAQIVNKIQVATQDAAKIQQNSTIKLRTWKSKSNRDKSIRHEIQLNSNELEKSIEDIVKDMKVGDIWEIKTENTFSESSDNVVIQIQQIIKESNIKFESVDGQILAEERKKEGNALIKQKKYVEAIQLYKYAYELVEYDCRTGSVQLKLSIMSNLALATLNAGKFGECIEWCNKHIRQSVDQNPKIIYRKANAEKGLKNWQSALNICKLAIEKWQQTPQIAKDFKNLLQIIEKSEKQQLNKEKKFYANMLG